MQLHETAKVKNIQNSTKKKLITSALPYVNNEPHLGNLIGSTLSADVFARYCKMKNYETLYICGTDEYGTATEIKALEEGLTPQEICKKYREVHKEIYNWFTIEFDIFGQTSTHTHTEIVTSLFEKLECKQLFSEKEREQFYDVEKNLFLADRFIKGECPYCGYHDARGDQCDNCGKLLSAEELKNPLSAISGTKPELKNTKHLYLKLPELQQNIEYWVGDSSLKGKWTSNTINISNAWLKEGLKERAITRDLQWGVKVPKEGFENKVFYVWFDAPIGYISITAHGTSCWQDWWLNPLNVELYQFMAKDNVPFHSIIFPAVILGTQENWTMVHHINTTEYLNYEGTKFSKSRGTGVFGLGAKNSGIPCDIWRYYLLSIRPEGSDTNFYWKDLQARNNNELLANLGNLINRVLKYVKTKREGYVPSLASIYEADIKFLTSWKESINIYEEKLEQVQLKEGINHLMAMAKSANKHLQERAPWVLDKNNREEADSVLNIFIHVIKDMSILIKPYLPNTSEAIQRQLNVNYNTFEGLSNSLPDYHELGEVEAIFKRIEDSEIEILQKQFSCSQ